MSAFILTIALLLSVYAHAVPTQLERTSDVIAPGAEELRPPDSVPFSAEAARAGEAFAKGRWSEAYTHAVQVMAQRIPDVDTLGALAVGAALLGQREMLDAALHRLLQVEVEPRYYHRLAQGIADQARGRTDAAIRQFSAVLLRTPRDHLALYLLGRAHEQVGRAADALREYEDALKAEPNFGPALAAAAQLRSNGGSYEDAVALIERAIAVDPTNPAFRSIAVTIYQRGGSSEKAAAHSAVLRRSLPGARESELFVAAALLRAGRPADVRNRVGEIARLFGTQAADHLLLAMAAADLQQYHEVQRELTEYLRLKPGDIEALSAASLVYISFGDGNGAVRLYQSAYAEVPGAVEARINLAVARQLTGERRKARALLTQAGGDGNTAELRTLLLASVQMADGDFVAYRRLLSQADAVLPGSAMLSSAAEEHFAPDKRAALAAWRNAAILMLHNGWSIPMERMADRALAVSPTDTLALYLKGLARKARGHHAEAADLLRRAIASAPRFASAHLALGDTLLVMKQIPDARAVLAAAEPLAQSGQALFQLAMLQRRAGNALQGRALLQRAMKTTDQREWRREAAQVLTAD